MSFKKGLLFLVLILAVSGVACQKKGSDSANNLNRIHFDYDSSSISPSQVKVIDSNIKYLKKHTATNIVVEGHCDERGTNEYNLALGDQRAEAAKDYMERKGVSEKRIRTVSYGEERPVDKGKSEASYYKNRRDEFVRR
ncbi:peptidoglycan-associated lipoprotein Pal [bacterium]|nr:peptidoglycan-associated lipoprotein Pal [bacterium]